jgi:hypothetical protein
MSRGAQFGIRNPNAVLNPPLVQAIRSAYNDGDISMRALSRIVGCSHTTIRKVVQRITWRSVR